jgi:molecular chaperone HtpG
MNKTNKKEQNKQKFAFHTETRELLKIMINSLYTHKEIFLRELISNASDALDKLHFFSLTNHELLENDSELKITLDINKKKKTLTISDNGIGMTRDEIIENIGTIAKSGSKAFIESYATKKEYNTYIDLIGKFGVGFYSAFMVADKVEIYSRAAGSKLGVKWESRGDGSFILEDFSLRQRGTKIVLFLKKGCYETSDPVEDLLNQYSIQSLIEKYSNYIKYPIKMDFYREEYPKDKDGKMIEGAEPEAVITKKVLNSMTPIWKRDKKDLTNDDYFQFYKHHFHDWNDYASVIHFKMEGKVNFLALLFIPSKAPSNLYDKDYTKGINLYCNDVFVMNDCKDLLPDHLRFIKGLVDSPDFSLNISREILQHDAQLKVIRSNIEKRVIEALMNLLNNNRKKYEEMWMEFGKAIKGGIYMDYTNKEKLQDLVLFSSSQITESMTTLREYVNRMSEGQSEIFYAAAKDIDTINRMPQLEVFRERNVETLYFIDKIDEFLTQNMDEYDGKKLISITREDFDFDKLKKDLGNKKEEGKEHGDGVNENNQYNGLLTCVKEHLGNKVQQVKLSKRLISSPVCLVNTSKGVTFNMEQLLKGVNQPTAQASKILEINPDHKLFLVLKKIYKRDKDSSEMKNCSEIMYYQSMLIQGYELDNPVDFSNRISELIVSAYDEKDRVVNSL